MKHLEFCASCNQEIGVVRYRTRNLLFCCRSHQDNFLTDPANNREPAPEGVKLLEDMRINGHAPTNVIYPRLWGASPRSFRR